MFLVCLVLMKFILLVVIHKKHGGHYENDNDDDDELCKRLKFDHSNKWYLQKPKNETLKISLGF